MTNIRNDAPTLRKAHKLHAICATLIVLCSADIAHADSCDGPDAPMVFPWTDPTTFAKPRKVLPPEYPAEALRKGTTAKVETSLRISGAGKLIEVLSMKADNGDATFEQAVRAVVSQWTFYNYTDCKCKPVDFTARLMVWFEIKDAVPTISVSSEPIQPSAKFAGKPLEMVNPREVGGLLSNGYPRKARRAQEEGVVYARLTINPESGATEAVDVQFVDAHPDYQANFAAAAENGLRKARYDLTGVQIKPPIKTCFEVSYLMRGWE